MLPVLRRKTLSASLLSATLGLSPVVLAEEWTDSVGEVSPAAIDIVSGSATVSDGILDLRVRFSAPPFPADEWTTLGWCMNRDDDTATGSHCAAITGGADGGVGLEGRPDALANCNFVMWATRGTADTNIELDHNSALWYDPLTYTVRVLVPLSYVSDKPDFGYFVVEDFFGTVTSIEKAPDSPDFSAAGGSFRVEEGLPLPFDGSLLCTREVVSIDIEPKNAQNKIHVRDNSRIEVAVLTTESFDATSLFAFTALFGPTGTEASPIQDEWKDVDRDGDLDLLLTYDATQTGIACGDTEATLKATGQDRQGVQGTAPIQTVGCRP